MIVSFNVIFTERKGGKKCKDCVFIGEELGMVSLFPLDLQETK